MRKKTHPSATVPSKICQRNIGKGLVRQQILQRHSRHVLLVGIEHPTYPIGSMGLLYLPTFSYTNQLNVGKYTIHGSCAYNIYTNLDFPKIMGFPFF